MPRSHSLHGDEITIDTHDLQKLALDLKRVDSVLRRQLTKRLKAASEPAKQAIAAEASWSSRIPAALKVRTSFAGTRGAAVKIVVDKKMAPEGKPLNNNNNWGVFRHPVFADPNKTRKEWTWTYQAARPFMARGAKRAMPLVEREVANVYDDIAKAAGFR